MLWQFFLDTILGTKTEAQDTTKSYLDTAKGTFFYEQLNGKE